MNQKIISFVRLSTFFFLLSFYSVQTANAQTCGGATAGSCPTGQACSCNQTNYDNCRDLGTNCTPEEVNCRCETDPSDQEACYHTICPVGYSCVGSGPSSYCQPPSGGGGGGECWNGNVNCPPDWTPDYNQPINTFCSIDVFGSNMCAYATGAGQLGNAQRETGCCNTKIDEFGNEYCPRNREVTTYSCCPPGSTPQCVPTTGETYTRLNDCRTPRNCNDADDEFIRTDGAPQTIENRCYKGDDPNDSSYGEWFYDVITTCRVKTTVCSCGGVAQTPTPTPSPVGSCLDVKAYTPAWVAHTTTSLSQLGVGNTVYFCARGSANMGTFTKAKFTINNGVRAETTTARPSSTNEFCDLYTIPANTYNFQVVGQVFHSTLGWIQ